MPATLSYPGVYIEEVPSGVRTIAAVSTSDTAFVDWFARGPLNEPIRITSFGDFERAFGGLDTRSESSYAIQQYFLNGGQVAYVVRVANGATPATLTLQGGEPAADMLGVSAGSPGSWGSNVQVGVDHATRDPATLFNLVAREVRVRNGKTVVVATEAFRNLSMDANSPRFAPSVVNNASSLVRLSAVGDALPAPTGDDVIGSPQDDDFANLAGTPLDGDLPGSTAWQTSGATAISGSQSARTGLFALEKIDPFVFNLLCLPGVSLLNDAGVTAVISAATAYCIAKRAFLLIDPPPDVVSVAAMNTWMADNDGLRSDHAAVYFPRLLIPDPLDENRPRNVGPSGTLAGVYARTDAARGVWKAPAGTDADLRGAAVAVKINDGENGALNPLGINALRTFPIFGNIAWGARTMDGADAAASEYKYIPVRRTALLIEESLYRGLKWVVFEPNDEPLWAQIRLNVGAFMQTLFRQGAFQGVTPRDAYFVKCDRETTTQNDINLGIVNILVGFAPLKPAEFVVVRIQQMAGQVQA